MENIIIMITHFGILVIDITELTIQETIDITYEEIKE